MFCKNCGSKLNGGSGFCSNCGTKSEGVNPNGNTVANPKQNNMNSNRSGYQPPRNTGRDSSSWQIVAIALAALVVFVGAATGVYLLMSSSKDSEEINAGQSKQVENNQEGQVESGGSDSNQGEGLENENKDLKAEEQALMEENERLKARIDYLNDSVYSNHSNSQAYTGGSYLGDTYYLTWSELNTYTRADIELIRNEIYARNGYIFKEARFKNYFSSMSWYRPNSGFHEGLFDSVEKANVNTIVEYESYRGWR